MKLISRIFSKKTAESRNIKVEFYKWINSRLKEYFKINNEYPKYFKSFENWQTVIDYQIKRTDQILKLLDRQLNNKEQDKLIKFHLEFMNWFKKNLFDLYISE